MTSNNYDDVAIQRAGEFANNENLAHTYIEKPAMFSLLPDLVGKKVLCVGCGTGEECAELLKRGAAVYGIDISAVSIMYAKEHVPNGHFRVVDMDKELESIAKDGPFDFIYSSLTVHYSDNVRVLLAQLHELLKPGGYFLFSTCHPVKWSAEAKRDPKDDAKKSFIMGYERNGQSLKVYGNYLEEQHLTQAYPNGLKVDYWMRTPSTYFKLLNSTGFNVVEFLEPSALPDVERIDPIFWEINHRLPQWIVFLAQKAPLT